MSAVTVIVVIICTMMIAVAGPTWAATNVITNPGCETQTACTPANCGSNTVCSSPCSPPTSWTPLLTSSGATPPWGCGTEYKLGGVLSSTVLPTTSHSGSNFFGAFGNDPASATGTTWILTQKINITAVSAIPSAVINGSGAFIDLSVWLNDMASDTSALYYQFQNSTGGAIGPSVLLGSYSSNTGDTSATAWAQSSASFVNIPPGSAFVVVALVAVNANGYGILALADDVSMFVYSTFCFVPARNLLPNSSDGTCNKTFQTNGTTCNLACQPGHTANGTLTVSCPAALPVSSTNNQWTLLTPNACLQDCAALPLLPAYALPGNCSVPTAGARAPPCAPVCPPGFSSNLSTTSCLNGAWSAVTGSCTPNPCAVPASTLAVNYTVCGAAGALLANGTTCNATCNTARFALQGSIAITCFRGTWSAPQGVCAPLPCPALPPAVASATVPYAVAGTCVAPAASGSTCLLACDSVHTPSPLGVNTTASCFAAVWSSAATFTCAANCATLFPLPNGNTTYGTCTANYPAAATCSLACLPRFSPPSSSPVTAQCDVASGTWSSYPTTGCSPTPCATPADNSSTIFSSTCPLPTTPSFSTCTPTCAPGYAPAVPTSSLGLTCLYGTFVPVSPSTTCAPAPCTTPSNTAALIYSSTCTLPSTASGSSCTPTCAPGYTASSTGTLTISCSHGSWSAPSGSCLPNPCLLPPDTASTVYSSACSASTASGLSCLPVCQTGYVASGDVNIVCTAGSWSTPAGTCVPRSCNVPADTATTVFSANCPSALPSGSSCNATCRAGYSASPSAALLLLNCSYGVLSGPSATCNPNPCPRPVDTVSTIYSQASCPSLTASGSTCTPSCAAGYNASQSLALTCTLGQFSNPAGVCAGLPCATPPDTSSTLYSSQCPPSVSSGSSCTPLCRSGYVVTGASLTIACLAGSFSLPTGSCTPAPCTPPSVTSPFAAGSCVAPLEASNTSCTLSCVSQYIPAGGSLQVTCINGAFTSPAGFCQYNPNRCPQPTPPFPLNPGNCPLSSIQGDQCTLGCAPGYTAAAGADLVAICLNTTLFDVVANASACLPLSCPAISAPSFGIGLSAGSCNTSSPTASGDACALQCLPGYTSTGPLDISCSLGVWSSPAGSCQPNSCLQPIITSPNFNVGTCPALLPSGQSCSLGCDPGFTPLGSFSLFCQLGSFSAFPPGICVAVAAVSSAATSLPTLVVSDGTNLAVDLIVSAGGANANSSNSIVVTPAQLTIGGIVTVFPTAASVFVVPDLTASFPALAAGSSLPFTVSVVVPSLGSTPVTLSAFTTGTMTWLPVPVLDNVCPDTLRVQTYATVVVRGSFFNNSLGTTSCILQGTAIFPAVQSSPESVSCVLYWPDASDEGEKLTLSVTNDGTWQSLVNRTDTQPPLSVTLIGACSSAKPNSIPATNSSGESCICPAGTEDTGSSCLLCPVGTYQDEAAQSGCKPCGLHQSTNGTMGAKSPTQCTCLPSYLPGPGYCLCPAGTYDQFGQGCSACGDGEYQPTAGTQTTCQQCGFNEDTFARTGSVSSSSCVCKASYYLNPRWTPTSPDSTVKCLYCQSGMFCPGDNVVLLRPGFWRASNATDEIVACPGGVIPCPGDLTLNISDYLAFSSMSATQQYCREGYDGPACAACSSTFYAIGTQCYQCGAPGVNIFALTMLIILGAVFCWYLVRVSTTPSSSSSSSSSSSVTTSSSAALDRSSPWGVIDDTTTTMTTAAAAKKGDDLSTEAVLKVALSYFQILFYLSRLSSGWSGSALQFLGIFGIVTSLSPSGIGPVQCVTGWTFYQKLTALYVAPAVIVAALFVIYAARHAFDVYRGGASLDKTIVNYRTACLTLLNQIHPTLHLEFVSSLPCQSIPGTGANFLKADVTVNCSSHEYKRFFSISVVLICVYIAGSIVFVLLQLTSHASRKGGDLFVVGTPAFRTYSFFFRVYHQHSYYYEAFIMTRKLAVASLFLLSSPGLQLVYAELIITFAYGLTAQRQPFRSKFINRLDLASLACLHFTVLLGFNFLLAPNTNHDWTATILIIINAVMTSILIGSLFSSMRHTIMRFIEKVLAATAGSSGNGSNDGTPAAGSSMMTRLSRRSVSKSSSTFSSPSPLELTEWNVNANTDANPTK